MPSPTVEGFSLSHAAILNGTTGAELADIYGIREGTLEVDTDNYDNTGDDSVLSSWQWFNFATVTVQSGFIPFDLLALLSGATITSSGTAPNDSYSIPLWSEKSLNTVTRPMLIRVPSKDTTGAKRFLDFVLYKVQFAPISFDGPSYKNGLLASWSGKATMSSVDEKGTVLTDRAIGRLVSTPAP
jgi:hypothetical protein